MITLYSAGGASDFELRSEAVSPDYLDGLLFNASQMLVARGKTQAAGFLATLDFQLSDAYNHFNDEFCVLHADAPLAQYEYLREAISNPTTRQAFKEDFEAIADVVSEIGPFVRFVALYLNQSQAPENWRDNLSNLITALSSNQALFSFKDSRHYVHDGLNFRSKTEIKIYDTLIKRGVLVLPLPVAVLGAARKYKEPDFVVCHRGVVGILEIHGDKWHPPETAAKEHERRRQFTNLGVKVYEIFGADRCWNDPDSVVTEFLSAFEG